MLAMLFGCVFRRSELVGLELDEVQMIQVLPKLPAQDTPTFLNLTAPTTQTQQDQN